MTVTSISAHGVGWATDSVVISASSCWLVSRQTIIEHVSQNDLLVNMSLSAAATPAVGCRGIRDRRAGRRSGGLGSVLSNDRGAQVEALHQRANGRRLC